MILNEDFWAPQKMENPDLLIDLKNFFFSEFTTNQIEQLLSKYHKELWVISNRYEFIQKLLYLKQTFLKNRKYKDIKLSRVNIAGEDVLKVARKEEIIWEGVELNGISYDIDALVQYLYLTIVDTIMGQIDFVSFTKWLQLNHSLKSYTLDKLFDLQTEYDLQNGLRKNFLKAFNEFVSETLKERIRNTFVICKLDLSSVNKEDMVYWNGLEKEDQYNKIVRYLYDKIRCMYTHSSSRTFLSDTYIDRRQPTKMKVLVSRISPAKDDLIKILDDVIVDLVRNKFANNESS